MPSPFPAIDTYGFLSDCHTGALVAADGSVDWLCVPRFDAPSVFGALLDREAGNFRLAPFGINVPTSRAYEPGTNTLVTTWRSPEGWVQVRDALTLGTREGDDIVTPHSRPPVDADADHTLVRTVECLEGHIEIELICEPVFDYGRTEATWTLEGTTVTSRRPAEARSRSISPPTCRWGSKVHGCGHAMRSPPESGCSVHCHGQVTTPFPPRQTKRSSAWRRPPDSGEAGLGGLEPSITRGGRRSSDPR